MSRKSSKLLILTNIHPIHGDTLTCIEDAIVTAAAYLKRDPLLMFAEAWNLRYQLPSAEKDQCLGQRLFINRGEYGTYTPLEGLCIERSANLSYDAIIELLQLNLSRCSPVALEIDSFWCPWNPGYQAYHSTHYCLIIGLDEEHQVTMCLDPNITQDMVQLPLSHIAQGSTHGYAFRAISSTEDRLPYKKILDNAASKVLYSQNENESVVHTIRSLAHEVEHTLNIQKETSGYQDLQYVPLFMVLLYIGWARHNFARLLLHFAQTYNLQTLTSPSAELIEAGQQWLLIRKRLMKDSLLPTTRLKYQPIKDRLNRIADLEEKVAEQILASADREI